MSKLLPLRNDSWYLHAFSEWLFKLPSLVFGLSGEFPEFSLISTITSAACSVLRLVLGVIQHRLSAKKYNRELSSVVC